MDPAQLKKITLFADVPDDQLAEIAPFASLVEVTPGKHLVDEGDYSYDFMAIEEGEAEVTRDGEAIATLGPGDFFGEMGLIEKTRRNATVVAKTPMRLVALSSWDLKRMQKSIPQAAETIRKAVEDRSADQ